MLAYSSLLMRPKKPRPTPAEVDLPRSDISFEHAVGRFRTPAVRVNVETRDVAEGINRLLCVARVVSATPITAIDKVFINGEEITVGTFDPAQGGAPLTAPQPFAGGSPGIVMVSSRLGTETDVDTLLAEYGAPGADGRHAPFALYVSRFDWNRFNDIDSQEPTVAIEGRGINVYDPDDVAQDPDDETTWTYSEDPALIYAWFVRQSWSFRASASEVDWPSISAAKAVNGATSFGGQARFRIGGLIKESDGPETILRRICETMGAHCLPPSSNNGKWGLVPFGFTTPVRTLTPRQFSRDDITDSLRADEGDRATMVRGEFTNEEADFTLEAFPPVQDFDALAGESPDFAAWLLANPSATYEQKSAEARKYHLETDVSYPYCFDKHQAQRLARYALNRSQKSYALSGTLGPIGLGLSPGDRVALDYPLLGLSGKTMMIVGVEPPEIGEQITVGVDMIEDDASVYAEGEYRTQPTPTSPVTRPPDYDGFDQAP